MSNRMQKCNITVHQLKSICVCGKLIVCCWIEICHYEGHWAAMKNDLKHENLWTVYCVLSKNPFSCNRSSEKTAGYRRFLFRFSDVTLEFILHFRPGYHLMSGTCIDIKECSNSSLNTCSGKASYCVELEGSYSCSCFSGYEKTNDGASRTFTIDRISKMYITWAKQSNIGLKNCLGLHSGVRRKFSWGVWFRVIWWSFVFGVLFVTSQFDVISMFPNQRFGEVCWHNNAYFSTSTPLTSCVIALNISYQRSKLGYRRKINSKLRHSSS